jgi:hypothetical protein
MDTTQEQGSTSPEANEPQTRILHASELEAPARAPQTEAPSAPAPQSADEQRLDAIEKEIEALDRYIESAETGRQKRDLTALKDKLQTERVEIVMRPTHEAAAQVEKEASEQFKSDLEAAAAERVECEIPVSARHREVVDAYTEDATDIAREAGIPMSEMSLIYNHVMSGVVDMVARDEGAGLAQGQIPGPNLNNRDECESRLRRQYGSMTESVVKQAAEGFARLPKSVQKYLDTPMEDGSLLTNHPAVVTGLWLWHSGYSRLSPEAAGKELATLRQSKAYMQKDGLTLAKTQMLASIVAQGHARAGKMQPAPVKAAKVAPSAKSKLETELRSLQLDPSYTDKSRPNHRQVLARVQAIFGELYPEGK